MPSYHFGAWRQLYTQARGLQQHQGPSHASFVQNSISIKKFSSLTGTCTVQKGSFCEQPSPNACDKQLHDTDVLCQIITRHYPRGNMHIACKITLHRRHDRIQSTLSRSKCADDYYCLMQQTTLDAHSVVSVSSTFRNQRKINGGSARYNMAVHTSCHFYGVLVLNHRYQSSICIQPIQYFLLIPQTFKGRGLFQEHPTRTSIGH